MKMILKSLLCYAILLVTVKASGDLVFLHHPEGIRFIGHEKIEQSDFTDVGLALLGLTPRQKPTPTWKGISIRSPFDTAEALIVVAVEGPETLESLKGEHFPLDCNEHEETTWTLLSEDLSKRHNESLRVRLNLGDDPNVFGQSALGELQCCPLMEEGQYKHLKSDKSEHRKFLEELYLLRSIEQKIPSFITGNKKTLIWLVVPGLNPIIESQGKHSEAFKEARLLLDKSLGKMSQAIANIKDQQVILTAFTSCFDPAAPTHSVRFKRASKESNNTRLVPGPKYDSNYPILFNIFLWFAVAFIFSLIAICVTIADMDPGRDSIIYRMTSNRMKKDN